MTVFDDRDSTTLASIAQYKLLSQDKKTSLISQLSPPAKPIGRLLAGELQVEASREEKQIAERFRLWASHNKQGHLALTRRILKVADPQKGFGPSLKGADSDPNRRSVALSSKGPNLISTDWGSSSADVTVVSASPAAQSAWERFKSFFDDSTVKDDDTSEGASGSLLDHNSLNEQEKNQLLAEVLKVHQDRISRGEVRIRRETIAEQQTVESPVSREDLVPERIPVTGITAVGQTVGADEGIRILLSEDVASIAKQTVVREEVPIGKRRVEHAQEVDGSLSYEELNVTDTPSNH